MMHSVSTATQAILLLTAPLLTPGRGSTAPVLSPREFKRLVQHLSGIGHQVADFVGAESSSLQSDCASVVDNERFSALLNRAFQLGPVLDSWHSRAIWVVGVFDPEYPEVLLNKMGEDAPALLYGCGERDLLTSGGLAIVGSRDTDSTALDFAESTARLAAKSGSTVISGGARGVDQVAMRGALDAGGRVVGVLSDSLGRAVIDRQNREAILDGILTLVSPYDPNAGFNVGNAMQRNKLIYALADAGLVVSSDLNKGGTWAGAKEQLDRYHFGPIFVRPTSGSPGLDALVARGSAVWPNPATEQEFGSVFDADLPQFKAPADSSLTLF